MPKKSLDIRAQRFIDAYLGSAAGNGTEAARAAGYAGNAKVLGVQSSRLLKRASIRKAIEGRQAKRTEKGILAADDRDIILSAIARGENALGGKTLVSDQVRIRAIAELNKCSGRHSIKHVLDGRLTLEQALTQSRK